MDGADAAREGERELELAMKAFWLPAGSDRKTSAMRKSSRALKSMIGRGRSGLIDSLQSWRWRFNGS